MKYYLEDLLFHKILPFKKINKKQNQQKKYNEFVSITKLGKFKNNLQEHTNITYMQTSFATFRGFIIVRINFQSFLVSL